MHFEGNGQYFTMGKKYLPSINANCEKNQKQSPLAKIPKKTSKGFLKLDFCRAIG